MILLEPPCRVLTYPFGKYYENYSLSSIKGWAISGEFPKGLFIIKLEC
jgi:hypothetical protein